MKVQCSAKAYAKNYFIPRCVDIKDKENKILVSLGHKVMWLCRLCIELFNKTKLSANVGDQLKEISFDIKTIRNKTEEKNHNPHASYTQITKNMTIETIKQAAMQDVIIRPKKNQTSHK